MDNSKGLHEWCMVHYLCNWDSMEGDYSINFPSFPFWGIYSFHLFPLV